MKFTDTTPFYPASYQQKRIWLLESFLGKKLYNNLTVEIEGLVDSDIMFQAINQTLERHEVFTIKLCLKPGLKYPVQVITEEIGVQVVQARLSGNKDPLTYLSNEAGPTIEIIKTNDAPHYLHFALPAEYCDGYTLYNLYREIAEEYQALIKGRSSGLQDDALQYIDFSEWQRELVAENEGEDAIKYWQNLVDVDELSKSITFEKSKHNKNGFELQLVNQKVNASLVKKITDITEKFNISLSAALLFSWRYVIARYVDDPIIGLIMQIRSDQQLKDMAGPVARTLPVKPVYNDEDQIIDALRHVNRLINGAREFQCYFEDNIRSQAENPKTFSFGFEFNEQPGPIERDGLKWKVINQHFVADIFKLHLCAFKQGPETMSLSIQYDQHIFDFSTVQNLLACFLDVIEYVSEGMDCQIGSIGIGTREKDLLFGKFNGGKSGIFELENFVRLFQNQAMKMPDKLAICFGEHVWTYNEVDLTTNKFARALKSKYQIKSGDLVAACAERSDQLIVALISIMKADASFVPLDKRWPKERIKSILQDCRAALLLTDEDMSDIATPSATLKECFELLKDEEDHNIAKISTECAYYIYTSGTTGKPKGVGVSHHSLANYLRWFSETYDISSDDSTTVFSSVAFDLSYTALWSTLITGATLYIAEDTKFLDVQALNKLLIRNKISYIKLTPSHFKMLISDVAFDECVKRYALRLIVLGGEEIKPEDIEIYLKQAPDVRFVNHYGPTEATIGAVACNIDQYSLLDFERCPVIGSPIANNKVFILNNDALAPIGEQGEICIAGPGLAVGYLNNAALTAEKFIELPLDGAGKKRVYKTGDIGRWLPTGHIEFKGRKDFQVKVRGYRIELGEIENVLLKHDAVRQALAIVQDENDDIRLAVYFAPTNPENVPDRGEILNYLLQYLPDYMVPAEIIALETFPLTAHGKIDRNALPPIAFSSSGNKEIARPLSEMETRLLNIWREALGNFNINVGDNFFDIGGHSLKATQIIARIANELKIKVSLKQLFNNSTVESLAKALETSKPEDYLTIDRIPEQSYYQASHAQRRLWIIDQMEKGSVSYNIPKAYAFHGELDIIMLEKALKTMISRHESLRTVFINISGEPKQRICEPDKFEFKLEYIDLQTAQVKEEQASVMVKEEAYKPFDLQTGPLIRFKIIHLKPEHYIFIFTIHHIISDAISKEIFIDECAQLYKCFSEGRPNPLPALRIQYKDYAAWENKQLSGENYKSHRSFWMNELSGDLPVIQLPVDKERPAIRSLNGKTISFVLDEKLSAQLNHFSQEKETTLFMTLLAALNVLLFRYSGQKDIIVGTPVSGRNHRDLEKQIGLYLNSLPLRIRFKGDCTFDQLLLQVKNRTLNAFDHQIYPFDKLIEDLGIKRDLSRSPLFDVVLVLGAIEDRDGELRDPKLPDLIVNNVDTGFRASNVDLRFVFFEKNKRIIGNVDYNADLFKNPIIKVMTDRLKDILSTMVDFPEKAISFDRKSAGLEIEKPIHIDKAFNFDF